MAVVFAVLWLWWRFLNWVADLIACGMTPDKGATPKETTGSSGEAVPPEPDPDLVSWAWIRRER